jgi:predicted ABC-type ATPase
VAWNLPPAMVVIAGPNGSGKSTLTRYLADAGLNFPNYQNADDLAAGRRGATAAAVQPVSRQALMADRASFSYETVLASASHVAKLGAARAQGYFVRLIFVATDDPAICLARVADRVAKGGHDIAPDRVRRNYQAAMHENLIPAIRCADECMIFDNSHGHAGGPLRVAHIIGKLVRPFASANLTWPEACLFSKLRADPDFGFTPD